MLLGIRAGVSRYRLARLSQNYWINVPPECRHHVEHRASMAREWRESAQRHHHPCRSARGHPADAECLGSDLSSFGTVEDFLQVLTSVLTVIARGEITPAEGAQIAERVDARYARAAPRTVDALAGHSNESGPDRSIP
jgi:hypothetical protein